MFAFRRGIIAIAYCKFYCVSILIGLAVGEPHQQQQQQQQQQIRTLLDESSISTVHYGGTCHGRMNNAIPINVKERQLENELEEEGTLCSSTKGSLAFTKGACHLTTMEDIGFSINAKNRAIEARYTTTSNRTCDKENSFVNPMHPDQSWELLEFYVQPATTRTAGASISTYTSSSFEGGELHMLHKEVDPNSNKAANLVLFLQPENGIENNPEFEFILDGYKEQVKNAKHNCGHYGNSNGTATSTNNDIESVQFDSKENRICVLRW